MSMLRWMCGLTRRYRVRIRNLRIRERVNKSGAIYLEIEGKRKRGRSKLRWGDQIEEDLREEGW